MVKTYKGVAVPSGVDSNLEALHASVANGVRGCVFATANSTVGDAGCSDVVCPNCICNPRHRDTLKEYLNKAEKESSMEEQIKKIVKPGMVLRTKKGEFFLWIGGAREEVYRLEHVNGRIALAECDSFDREYDDVDAVYANHNGATPAVCVFSLADLMRGRDCMFAHCVWKRPEPAKEMTVDDISKALGYKVKVVGNEKTDD